MNGLTERQREILLLALTYMHVLDHTDDSNLTGSLRAIWDISGFSCDEILDLIKILANPAPTLAGGFQFCVN